MKQNKKKIFTSTMCLFLVFIMVFAMSVPFFVFIVNLFK